MKYAKWLWGLIDGNKTIICSLLLAWMGGDGAMDLFAGNMWLYDQLYLWLVAATGGSAAHHVNKGHLKVNA